MSEKIKRASIRDDGTMCLNFRPIPQEKFRDHYNALAERCEKAEPYKRLYEKEVNLSMDLQAEVERLKGLYARVTAKPEMVSRKREVGRALSKLSGNYPLPNLIDQGARLLREQEAEVERLLNNIVAMQGQRDEARELAREWCDEEMLKTDEVKAKLREWYPDDPLP